MSITIENEHYNEEKEQYTVKLTIPRIEMLDFNIELHLYKIFSKKNQHSYQINIDYPSKNIDRKKMVDNILTYKNAYKPTPLYESILSNTYHLHLRAYQYDKYVAVCSDEEWEEDIKCSYSIDEEDDIIDELNDQLDTLKEDLDILVSNNKRKIDDLDTQIANMETMLEEFENDVKDKWISGEIMNPYDPYYQEPMMQMSEDIERMEEEIEQLEEEIELKEQEVESKEEEIEQLKEKLEKDFEEYKENFKSDSYIEYFSYGIKSGLSEEYKKDPKLFENDNNFRLLSIFELAKITLTFHKNDSHLYFKHFKEQFKHQIK